MSTQGPRQHKFYIDVPLLLLLLALMSVGLMVLYSAGGMEKMSAQALRFGVGLTVMALVLLIPRYVIRFFAPLFYLLTVVLLLMVYLFGVNINGSQRWLNIGIATIQPSEIAKISIPLMLAYYYHAKSLPPSWKDIAISVIVIVIPTLLVFKQPDLGTAILVASSGLVLLFLTGISWRLIGMTVVAIAGLAPLFWMRLMSPYQKERVLTFLNPASDPTGSGYNIIQSKIAIGSGGLTGKGYMQGVQSSEFLPEHTTDFIFAVFSEEFGFFGVVLLCLLYLLILLRGFWLAVNMTDNFSRLLSGAFMFIFFAYFFINMSMVSGILPVVGLPLPLVSYGGTSIITIMLAFGLMMNLYGARDTEQTGRGRI
ncbi:MAG: rod shape-determining protein RodA [Gammaproteobacteria bacterium]|nr:MAG: rod shape-determining protein RodA [Gammaproteobacteria bacterium]